jgi:hypothetical protein
MAHPTKLAIFIMKPVSKRYESAREIFHEVTIL